MGAGKSAVANYFKELTNSEIIKYSDVLAEILTILNIEKERKNFANLSKSLRDTFSEDILENAVINKITNSEKKVIILDGVRRKEDIKLIKEISIFNLIFIDTSLKTRSERMKNRFEKEDDEKINKNILENNEKHDSENRVNNLKNISNFIIDNNGTLEDLKKNIEKIITKTLK